MLKKQNRAIARFFCGLEQVTDENYHNDDRYDKFYVVKPYLGKDNNANHKYVE